MRRGTCPLDISSRVNRRLILAAAVLHPAPAPEKLNIKRISARSTDDVSDTGNRAAMRPHRPGSGPSVEPWDHGFRPWGTVSVCRTHGTTLQTEGAELRWGTEHCQWSHRETHVKC